MDGKLQYAEVLKGYTEFFGEELAENETKRIFALVDVDNSGEIDFSEFVLATVNRSCSSLCWISYILFIRSCFHKQKVDQNL